MSRLVSPRAASAATSVSRRVSVGRPPGGEGSPGSVARARRAASSGLEPPTLRDQPVGRRGPGPGRRQPAVEHLQDRHRQRELVRVPVRVGRSRHPERQPEPPGPGREPGEPGQPDLDDPAVADLQAYREPVRQRRPGRDQLAQVEQRKAEHQPGPRAQRRQAEPGGHRGTPGEQVAGGFQLSGEQREQSRVEHRERDRLTVPRLGRQRHGTLHVRPRRLDQQAGQLAAALVRGRDALAHRVAQRLAETDALGEQIRGAG